MRLYQANQLAWEIWQRCNRTGRDGFSGQLRGEVVVALTAAMDGDEEDFDKIFVIEAIAESLRPEKEPDKRDGE